MNRFILYIILMVLSLSITFSQYSQQKSVVGSAGGKSTDGTYNLKSNVGEPSGTTTGSGYTINSGFLGASITIPNVVTASMTSISVTSANSGGNVTDNGGATVSARGIVWSTTAIPTLTTNEAGHTTDGTGTGSFTSAITGLTYNTLYYVRAYATNSAGTAYGNEITFTTIPTLGEWGLIAMGLLFAGFGGWFVWRRIV